MDTGNDLFERTASTDPVDSKETARDTIEATMETLGERITDGQAADLAERLPDVGAEPLRDATPSEAEEFSLATFAARQAAHGRDRRERRPRRADRSRTAALTGVAAVADETELARTREQLPDEFDLVFDPGDPMDADEFRDLVADDLPDALDAHLQVVIDAALETLAESDAIDLTRAVFGAIRETAADSGLDNVRTQLPGEYGRLFPD